MSRLYLYAIFFCALGIGYFSWRTHERHIGEAKVHAQELAAKNAFEQKQNQQIAALLKERAVLQEKLNARHARIAVATDPKGCLDVSPGADVVGVLHDLQRNR